jgi:hypothetical protein
VSGQSVALTEELPPQQALEVSVHGFSRSLYRTLAPAVWPRHGEDALACRRGLMTACEASMERLAFDHSYFRRPVRTIFSEVRDRFRVCDQEWALHAIKEHVETAADTFEVARAAAAAPPLCTGTNRFGERCQRPAKPGCSYCPSHRHLEAV